MECCPRANRKESRRPRRARSKSFSKLLPMKKIEHPGSVVEPFVEAEGVEGDAGALEDEGFGEFDGFAFLAFSTDEVDGDDTAFALHEEVDGNSGNGIAGERFPADGAERRSEVGEGGFDSSPLEEAGSRLLEVAANEGRGREFVRSERMEDGEIFAGAGDGDVEDILAFGEAAGSFGAGVVEREGEDDVIAFVSLKGMARAGNKALGVDELSEAFRLEGFAERLDEGIGLGSIGRDEADGLIGWDGFAEVNRSDDFFLVHAMFVSGPPD